MKSILRITALFALLTAFSVQLKAQEADFEEILNESVADAEKIIGPYVEPLMNTVSASLNQGWYNTAKPHKIAGIDLTITLNMMGIPTDQLSYRPNDLNLSSLELADNSPGYPNAPTIFGKKDEPQYQLKDDPTNSVISGPPGLDLKGSGLNRVPVPMAQLGIGLPKGTDLKLRFVPTIDLGEGATVKMFGLGVMHDIKQWIPGIKELPFDLSGFVGHTSFRIDAPFEEDPDDNIEDGAAALKMSATTIQGVISKKVSVLTVYGGLGYNITKSNIAINGKFDINGNNNYNDPGEVNPFRLDFAASGPRLSAGMRLKLAVFTFHGEYTLQKYSCLTAGFGISIR